MLFEWYYLRAKISEENEIQQQNIIQLYDIESTIDKFYRVAKMRIFNLKNSFKKESFNLSINEYNSYLMKNNFEKNAKNFFESHSSHIEILVPCILKENESKGDPFLNIINNTSEKVKEDNKKITKYLAVQPRFLLMTQIQKKLNFGMDLLLMILSLFVSNYRIMQSKRIEIVFILPPWKFMMIKIKIY